MDGKFITQVGAKGNGPGEYNGVYDFHIDEIAQTITVTDTRTQNLIVYDLNTYRYISQKNIPFSFSTYITLPDGYYAWYSIAGFKKAMDYYYVQIKQKIICER
ncbi:hypothetical protein AGMMS49574_20960 [Bacteroidia bacterium]|nr:hypothetical protein AGMMS49574_20960 [Bacteroidia bacterium]